MPARRQISTCARIPLRILRRDRARLERWLALASAGVALAILGLLMR